MKYFVTLLSLTLMWNTSPALAADQPKNELAEYFDAQPVPQTMAL